MHFSTVYDAIDLDTERNCSTEHFYMIHKFCFHFVLVGWRVCDLVTQCVRYARLFIFVFIAQMCVHNSSTYLAGVANNNSHRAHNRENKMVRTRGISQNQILSFNSYAILLQCVLFRRQKNIIVFELNCVYGNPLVGSSNF